MLGTGEPILQAQSEKLVSATINLVVLSGVVDQCVGADMVIIDTDPGIDDATAILMVLGAKNVRVLGFTTVRGNAGEPDVAKNVLKLLQLTKRTYIPVFEGADFNLIDSPSSDKWFGNDGFWDIPFPDPLMVEKIRQTHSAIFLANTVKMTPGKITVLAIGPLTNIALAIHLNPDFLKQAKEVIILGGSIQGRGNVAPGIEFNIYMDPDSAAIVLQKALSDGVQLTLVPLETVLDNDLGKEWRFKTLAEIKNPAFQYLDKLERIHVEKHPVVYANSYLPADAYAAAAFLSKESVLETKSLYGYVENRGEKRSRGLLIVDYFNVTHHSANLRIVTAINKEAIRQMLLTNLGSLN